MRTLHVLALTLLAGSAAQIAVAAPAADVIVTHARIWTGNPAQPESQALAVLDARIVAVGSEHDIAAWRGPKTTVVDSQGKRLIPGFDDAHTHVLGGGELLGSVQLNDATSAQEFVHRIAERAKITAKGKWLRGGNWDETKWTPAALPTRQMIDAFTADIPVALDRYDGHLILVNSLALKLAGITAATQDPPGGVIVRDAGGEPTGILKDAAMDAVIHVIPPLAHDERRAILERALQHAASVGVTSLQEMSDGELVDDYADLGIYQELAAAGKLPVRVYVAPAIAAVDDLAKVGIRHAFGSVWVRTGALKTFADGSVGSRTAYFYADFDDQPGNHGLLGESVLPLSLAQDRMIRADAAGLQLYTHAIGDRGISTMLDLYSEVEARNGPRDRR